MHQVLFRIPIKTEWTPDGVPIYGFGMMLFAAFLLCTWMACRRAEKAGISRDLIQDMVIYIFLGGLVGARVTYLLNQDRSYTVLEFIQQLPRIWDGGIILYGSVLGGLAGYGVAWWRFIRKANVSTLQLADILAPTIAVGLCLGRIGCFLNGCCYGQVVCDDCHQAYSVHFPLSAPARYALVQNGTQTAAGFTLAASSEPGALVDKVDPTSAAHEAGLRSGHRIVEINGQPVANALALHIAFENWPRGQSLVTLKVEQGHAESIAFAPRTLGLHPTQLYESISMILLLLVILAYEPLRTRDGSLIAILMIGYGIHRYLNELLRDDPRPEGFERYGSLLLITGGVALALWIWRRPAQYELKWAQ